MRSDDEMPGKKIRRNRHGPDRIYWVARADLVAQGYEPRTVRLHYDPTDRVLIAAACQRLQAEMLAWAAGRRTTDRPFDGTLASLIRLYQHDQASPYRDLKWNTRRTYDQVLGVIEKAFGKRSLAAVGIADFRRWYDEAKKPKQPGSPERVRKAHGIIAMLRRLFAYGVTAEHPHCARLAAILDEARFKQPGRRRLKLELPHVEAFIPKAIEAGRLSLAIGTAMQFETTLRQRDVIGEWEPIPEGEAPTGIVLGGRRWVRGLTWADITADQTVSKETTKTGAVVGHDLRLCPLVLDLLDQVPAERRVGPLIIDETAGRPYAEHAYAREWRVIARTAGIPDAVWNMDARSGGISEADDAGADLDLIRSAAGHTQASTTARYVRGTIGKSRKVAELRLAHRTSKNGS
ncbi:integrase [Rhodoplanes serenus]|uniref:Integrase n=1 Tax=Rhodoplanes serenus TaxID=200615 RepID=A0A9X4XJ28_9BRAD|nr:integrase [Rhodoplanes serenus]MTW16107.1 integrase [Rhodoplanes serenus]